jgi:anti-anti-sigma factor
MNDRSAPSGAGYREVAAMVTQAFTAELTFDGRALMCRLVGRVARDSIPDIEDTVRGHIERGCRQVVVDLSRGEGISSTGIGLMVYYSRMLASKGGHLVFVRPTGAAWRALTAAKADGALEIYDTLEEAVAATAAAD